MFLLDVVLDLVVCLVPEHEVHGVAGQGQEGHVYVAPHLEPVAVLVQVRGVTFHIYLNTEYRCAQIHIYFCQVLPLHFLSQKYHELPGLF